MPAVRIALAALFLIVAVTVQTSLLPHIAVAGVSCDLVMIVVVALALSRGAEWGAIAGFLGGLMLDVAPPPTTRPAVGRSRSRCPGTSRVWSGARRRPRRWARSASR